MSRVWLQTGDMTTSSVSNSFASSIPVGTAAHQSEVAAVGNFDNDNYPDIVIGNRLFVSRSQADFAYRKGIEIGPRDFVQVYAGNVNGDNYDDVVGVYADGVIEVFFTINNPSNPFLAASGGIGFHSAGKWTALVGHQITTINFMFTLNGYGTGCRGEEYGCTNKVQRAVFVGTADTDDYLLTSSASGTSSCHHQRHQFRLIRRPRPRLRRRSRRRRRRRLRRRWRAQVGQACGGAVLGCCCDFRYTTGNTQHLVSPWSVLGHVGRRCAI